MIDSPLRRMIRNLHLLEPGEDRTKFVVALMQYDVWTVGVEMKVPMNDDNIYRVSVFPDGVDVVCFGLESVDSELEGHYDDIDLLPDWVKERLAVLNMMPSTAPTNEVVGIGRRISDHVYWVFAPDTLDASTSA